MPDEKLAEFTGSPGHLLRARARNQKGELPSDGRRAAARERYDFVEAFEYVDEVLTQRSCAAALAGCEEGLTTTRLLFRVHGVEPERIEHVERGQADLGPQLIDVAGNEEGDSHIQRLRASGSPTGGIKRLLIVEHMSLERR